MPVEWVFAALPLTGSFLQNTTLNPCSTSLEIFPLVLESGHEKSETKQPKDIKSIPRALINK